MRASEIASHPQIVGKVAVLADSKTGEGRSVPLSDKAIEELGGKCKRLRRRDTGED